MKVKFKTIDFGRMDPFQYAEKLDKNFIRSLDSNKYYYSDRQFGSSEIFCEKISDNFIIFSMDVREETDTCYIFPPRNSFTKYYSINYYEAQSKFGYKTENRIKWINKLVTFSAPFSTQYIYLKGHSTIRIFCLIFVDHYLSNLLLFSNNLSLSNSDVGKILQGYKYDFVRDISELELIAIHRLKYMLKYDQLSFHYFLSLTASAFNLADCFFKASIPENYSTKLLIEDEELMAKVRARLEILIYNKFPGINALASEFNMSPTKLKVSFKRFFNVTPLVYFRSIQMIHAMEILQKKELAIHELSRKLGFEKNATFYLWFKRYFNKNPTEI